MAALRHESAISKKSGILSGIGSFGSAITVGLCPICIPAIGALLSSIGLGFLVNEAVLRPVLIGSIAFAWFGFGWSYYKEHRNPCPGLLGLCAGISLYVGRYVYLGGTLNVFLMYGGVIAMIVAGVWNLIVRKRVKACPDCVDQRRKS